MPHYSLTGFWLPVAFCAWLVLSVPFGYAAYARYRNKSLPPKEKLLVWPYVPAFQLDALFGKLTGDMGLPVILLLVNYRLVHVLFLLVR